MPLTEGRTPPNNINEFMTLEIREQTHAQIPVPTPEETREGTREGTPEGTRGINETLEPRLARHMVFISHRRCRGMARHGTHTGTLLRQWAPRSTPGISRDSLAHQAPLPGRAASLSRLPISRRLLARWRWEDRVTPKCIQDAKSPGMEESTIRSVSLSSSTKRTG